MSKFKCHVQEASFLVGIYCDTHIHTFVLLLFWMNNTAITENSALPVTVGRNIETHALREFTGGKSR